MKNKEYILQRRRKGCYGWVFKQRYTTHADAIEGLRFYVDQQTRIGGDNIFRIVEAQPTNTITI